MKFRIFPEAAGVLAGFVFMLVAVVWFIALVCSGEMTMLYAACYLVSVAVLCLVVWDIFVYVAAWLQLNREQFRRFRESRDSLLKLLIEVTAA